MKFDNDQKRAIEHINGPFLLIAGPGSGKTTTMIERLANMILNHNIPSERILVITFSRAAAIEMQSRFIKRMNTDEYKVVFGTFHSIFLSMIKKFFKNTINLTLIDDINRKKYIKDAIKTLGFNYVPNDLVNEISLDVTLFKNSDIEISSYSPVSCDLNTFMQIYSSYDEFLLKNENIDFDDIIILMNNLLEYNSDFRCYWQEQFDYILIDEFQDINSKQFNAISILSKKHNNIFAVGDEDQSIYSFRGSKPEIMLDFPNVFNNAIVSYLSNNYRSGRNIVECASSLISNNKNRFSKKFVAHNDFIADINFYKFYDIYEQIDAIKEEVLESEYSSAAILCRTNDDKKLLMEKLRPPYIEILTLHESKGLEFDFVWIFNAANNICPFKHPLYKCNIEEERRLFYVGITRARKKLCISYCTAHKGIRRSKSRFIKEMKIH